MSDPFWRDLIKQDRLEEMYEIFRKRPGATDKGTAMQLARFAEAHMYNAADRRIVELEIELEQVRNPLGADGQVQWRLADLERRMNEQQGEL